MTLLESVKARLLALPRSEWPLIAGIADVPLSTLQKVAHGHHPDPRVSTVEQLYTALEQRRK